MEKERDKSQFIDGLVSVITPLYNCEKFIAQTIDSIVSQTYKNIEIIIVDDCSTDNSKQVVLELQKKYPQIVYSMAEVNGGSGIARNIAMKIAKGRYVAFCDSDDIWKPEKLQKQLELMEKTKTPLCYTAIEMIDSEGNPKKKKRKIKRSIKYSNQLRNTMIATSSVIVDRGYYGEIEMHPDRYFHDYALWLKLLRNGETACGIDEALVSYRVWDKTFSKKNLKSISELWYVQTKLEGICGFKVFFNLICFVCNALKKYLF